MEFGRISNLALRGLQFLWALLIIALVGNMIHDAIGGNPSIVNYSIFVGVFAMLSLIYLIAGSISEGLSGHPLGMVIVDAINTLLFFCGAVALSAQLRVHSCGRSVRFALNHFLIIDSMLKLSQSYVDNNSITRGSHNNTKRCHEAQAVCAFLWFGFAAFAASLVFSGLATRGSTGVRGGGLRKGGPSMSHV
ncbi:MAG: hypothetical protein M1836_002818 [Candelina mexicana]|nr:MAG: hypothetical protein M1836_002818 [Candelina mexicana]